MQIVGLGEEILIFVHDRDLWSFDYMTSSSMPKKNQNNLKRYMWTKNSSKDELVQIVGLGDSWDLFSG